MMLTEEEVPEELIKGTRIFHFGTLSMTHEGVRNATKKALRAAKEAGTVISFDPNLREPLWNSLDEAKEQVLYGLGQCDILKISDNEIQWLTGEEDFTKGVHWILERYHIPLILVSMGREGSRAYYRDNRSRRYLLCMCSPLYFRAWTYRSYRGWPERDADFCKCSGIHYHYTQRCTPRNAGAGRG